MNSHVPKFGKLPIEAAIDRRPDRLSYNDYIVLSVLYAFADGDGYCYPPRSLLAMITGISMETISRITTHLAELGWLEKSGPRGRSRPNEYYLSIPESLAEKVREINTLYEKQRMQKSRIHSDRKDVANLFKGVPETSTRIEHTNNIPIKERRVEGLPLSSEILEQLERNHPYINIFQDLARLPIWVREKGEKVRDWQARAERWLLRASDRYHGAPESGSWLDRQRSIENQAKLRFIRLQDEVDNFALEWAESHPDDSIEEIEAYATENIPSEHRQRFIEVAEGWVFRKKHQLVDEMVGHRNGRQKV